MKSKKRGKSAHDKKVKQVAKQFERKGWNVEADISEFDSPDSIGQNNFVPDIVAKKSGATKIIEVETKRSLEKDKDQQEAFRRSAGQKKRTTFEIIIADENK